MGVTRTFLRGLVLASGVFLTGHTAYGQTAACCVGDQCQELEQAACDGSGGAWLGVLVPPVLDCTNDPCATGACCVLGGAVSQCWRGTTAATCDGSGGNYYGGLDCSESPCATCDFGDVGQCQDSIPCKWVPCPNYINRSLGIRWADDFRPATDVIERVCFEVGFVTENPPPECSDDPPLDGFEVRLYEDAFGVPGTELADSPGSSFTVDSIESGVGGHTHRLSGPVDPVDGVQVVAGGCYWIEVSAAGSADCKVDWLPGFGGNRYSMRDTNGVYELDDARLGDMNFCIDTGIIPAINPGVDGGCGDIPVACCTRGPACENIVLSECTNAGGVFFPYQDCSAVTCAQPANDNCEDATVVCEGMQLDDDIGQCTEGPDGQFGAICSVAQQDCVDPLGDPPGSNPCVVYQCDAYQCHVATDNRLANTDGPPAGGDCFGSGQNSFQSDVWYRVPAPCRGEMIITMCGAESQYDSMLAVYGDGTADPACPGNSNDTLLTCNDDYCAIPGAGTVSGVTVNTHDDATYLIRVGGWSANGTPIDAAQGISELHIGFLCHFAIPYIPPELPQNPIHSAPKQRYLSIDASVYVPQEVAIKVELISMKRCGGDLRRACSVDDDCPNVCVNNNDVTCTDGSQCDGSACIPTGPCIEHPDVGLSWWVQPPQRQDRCPGPGGPPCGDEDWYARLDSAVYTEEWASYSTLHIGDCEILPAATYGIAFCDPVDPSICADGSGTGGYCASEPPVDPFLIATQPVPFNAPGARGSYGDVVGPVDGPTLQFTPPDGIANVNDILGYIKTMQNYGTPNKPQAHPTWIDLHGLGSGNPPNYILGVSDLLQIKFGLLGQPWANASGNLQPGDCP